MAGFRRVLGGGSVVGVTAILCAMSAGAGADMPRSLPAGPVSNLASLPSPLISLDLREIDVKDALRFLAEKATLNIVPTNQVAGRISLKVDNVAVDDVFALLIRANRLAYEKIGTIYNVMTEKEYRDRFGRGFDDTRQVRVFRLRYAAPDQAFAIVDSLKSSIGKVLVDGDAGTITVLDTPEQLRLVEQTIGDLEHKTTTRMFSLHYARAEDVARQLKAQLDAKKIGSVRYDERTNQIIVQTLPDRMTEIETLVQGLDQKTRAVLIDARIIQVKLSDALSAGVQWEGLFNLSKKYGTTYLGSYPFSAVQAVTADWRSRQQVADDVGYVGAYPFSGTTADISAGRPRVGASQMHVGLVGKHDFDVMISYLKTLGEVKILSNPKLSVTNNQEARVHVGERTAYITNTTTAGQTTTTVSETVTFLDVGLQLYITPTINEQGYVTLRIKPEISSIVGEIISGQSNKIPVIDTSTAETTVMLKDGNTVAVGGLRRDEESSQSVGVPFLSRLPLLGALFRQEMNTTRRNELLILVTAHILQGDELETGNQRDFGRHLNEAYQDYTAFVSESDVSGYEQSQGASTVKGYQEYVNWRPEPAQDPAAAIPPPAE